MVWHVVLNQTQVTIIGFQFCRPAIKTKKEGKGKSAIEKGTQSLDQHMLTAWANSLATYIFKRTRLRLRMSGLLLDEISFNITTFVTDWNRLNGEQTVVLLQYQHLCNRQESAIFHNSSVLNGLQIKPVQLFTEFAFIGSRIFLLGICLLKTHWSQCLF